MSDTADAPDITPAQCRMAREGLQWSQPQLAKAATVSLGTVQDFESGKSRERRASTMTLLRQAFEAAGIEFISEDAGGGVGLRFRKGKPAAPSSARKAKAKRKAKR